MIEPFNLYEYYKQMIGENIILTFKGALSQEILVEMGQLIRNHLSFSKKIKKIFSVFIELSQNIMYYSAEKEIVNNKQIGVGIIVFTEASDAYTVYSGNAVKNSDVKSIIKKLETVNKLSNDELKSFFHKERRSSSHPKSRGAGLGFIEIARKSEEAIAFKVCDINDEESFLSLTVRIKKNND